MSLADFGVMEDIKDAYKRLKTLLDASGQQMPKNGAKRDGVYLRRSLDCAVIDMVHFLRAEEKKQEYDSVIGIFEGGPRAFPGAGFKEKTHIQIAVRNPKCIIGYFQVRGYEVLR
jgi:hypothetical protein